MGRRLLGVIASVLLALACGFVAGAWWEAKLDLEPPAGPAVAEIAVAPTQVTEAARPRPAVLTTPAVSAATDPRCTELSVALAEKTEELTTVRQDLKRRDEHRAAQEGSPIPLPARPADPRFAPEALRAAISQAFKQENVPGRVDGLDCTEWPCIIYGRIRGTEDEMEKLEGAKALATYEHDVLTVLLWVVTDEAAHEGRLPLLPGRPEQSLFAFAFYPRGLERPVAENVDRRLRSRTAELWNTMSPSDESGR